jgi:hypothetical protein
MWFADDLFRPLTIVRVKSLSGFSPVIVSEKPTAWELFFVSRGSVILRILPQTMAVIGLTLLLVAVHRCGSPASESRGAPWSSIVLRLMGSRACKEET